MSDRFYMEMKRHYYTTPSSYLELLKLYREMLKVKKVKVEQVRDRIANGLHVSFKIALFYCLISCRIWKTK